LAGYKTISLALLIVLVVLVGVSPVFAPVERVIIFDPPSACRGATVTFTLPAGPGDIVGGGISIAAVSPLAGGEVVLSSNPDGLSASDRPECSFFDSECTFQVSESARCGRYTVTITSLTGGLGAASISGTFDVAGSCCAVGGCVQPVNTFALLSPWMAVIGLIGCMGTVVVVTKKRHP
jgi:hypothetical protein